MVNKMTPKELDKFFGNDMLEGNYTPQQLFRMAKRVICRKMRRDYLLQTEINKLKEEIEVLNYKVRREANTLEELAQDYVDVTHANDCVGWNAQADSTARSLIERRDSR